MDKPRPPRPFPYPNPDDSYEIRSAIITIDPEQRRILVDEIMSIFLGEECRICGQPITDADLIDPDGLKFTGRHERSKRAAHLRCWNGMIETLRDAPSDRLAALLAPPTPSPTAPAVHMR